MVFNSVLFSFSLQTLILLLFNIVFLGVAFYLVNNNLNQLTTQIDYGRGYRTPFVTFFLISGLLGLMLFLFVRRISPLGSFLGFTPTILALLVSIIVLLSFLIVKNRLLFKSPRRRLKGGAILLLLVFSLFPYVLGVLSITSSDPIVAFSAIPKEIYFENVGQVKDVADVDLTIKMVQGYAWNINISLEAPSTFNIWLDGVENGTKTIPYLETENYVSYPLKIQPSRIVENGTYTVDIHWSYEISSGGLVTGTNSITTYVGKAEYIDMYYVPAAIGIIIAMAIIAVLLLKLRKR